jgi:hypothetical protein
MALAALLAGALAYPCESCSSVLAVSEADEEQGAGEDEACFDEIDEQLLAEAVGDALARPG